MRPDDKHGDERGAFWRRVTQAAEAALAQEGAVGPIDVFRYMGLLQPSHFDNWRRGHEEFPVLEKWILVGPAKFEQTLKYFAEWVKERNLAGIEAPYLCRMPSGVVRLRVTEDGEAEREKFYATRYAAADVPARKTKQITEKLTKAPDLVVFEKVSEEGNCSECGAELTDGSFLCMEKGKPLCLACADLDHLVFLPAGDTALSRRSRKHSSLSAVVVRFNRRHRRYERQGLLVTSAALEKAEQECVADAPERASRREVAAVAREAQDAVFINEMTAAILKLYAKCPASEARAIAAHAGQRGSGRVGRSAAGRALNERALELAVRAHIRHEHTNYDTLLMQGTDRTDARALVRDAIERVVEKWSGI